MNAQRDLGSWLAKQADLIVLNTSRVGYHQVCRRIDKLERTALRRARTDFEIRETVRRLGDLRIMAAILMDRGAYECAALLKARTLLGYRDKRRHVMNVVSVARHCADRGASKTARVLIERFLGGRNKMRRDLQPIPKDLRTPLRYLLVQLGM